MKQHVLHHFLWTGLHKLAIILCMSAAWYCTFLPIMIFFFPNAESSINLFRMQNYCYKLSFDGISIQFSNFLLCFHFYSLFCALFKYLIEKFTKFLQKKLYVELHGENRVFHSLNISCLFFNIFYNFHAHISTTFL